jgi:hypothetical protein
LHSGATNPIQNNSHIRALIKLARAGPVPAIEPSGALSREAGMQLECDIAAGLQQATAALQSARAELQRNIDDPRLFPDETLQSGIRYWAAVRNLTICLRLQQRLHAGRLSQP